MNEKLSYEAPQVEVFNLKGEGIICASTNNPFDGLTEHDV